MRKLSGRPVFVSEAMSCVLLLLIPVDDFDDNGNSCFFFFSYDEAAIVGELCAVTISTVPAKLDIFQLFLLIQVFIEENGKNTFFELSFIHSFIHWKIVYRLKIKSKIK